LPAGVTPDEAHRALKRACQCGSANPKVRDIVVALNRAQKFEQLPPSDPNLNPVVFSTIHRSKGREFDEVAYVDYVPWEGSEEPTPGYNQRMRFVGLSRAKQRNFSLDVGEKVLLAKPGRSERWAEFRFLGKGSRGLHAAEVGVQGDVDPVSFVRYPTFAEAQAAQSSMLELCKRGETVDLVLGQSTVAGAAPLYSIIHRASGRKVGEMSARFTRDIQATRHSLQGWGGDFPPPVRLEGCWVRGVFTATPGDCESMDGLPAEVAAGLIWCYVEVEGFAKAIWP
jgi:hypothetical protein